MSIQILLLVLLFSAASLSIPVSKSHIKSYPSKMPCNVWHWDLHPLYTFQHVTPEAEETFPSLTTFSKLYTDVISRGSNCSIHFHFISGSIGDFLGFDVNGSARYNGLIGDLQEGKYDFAIYYFRPDSLPHEPVIIGPVVSAADVGILSGTSLPTVARLPFMSFMANFDSTTYSYSLIGIHLFLCMIIFVSLVKVNRRRRRRMTHKLARKIVKQYYNNGFRAAAGIMRQQLFPSSVSGPHRILILSFSLFCFFTVTCHFLNLFSADLTVIRSPAVIDSIHDLLSDKFSHVSPVIIRKLWLKNMLAASPVGTPLSHLYERVMRDPNVTMFDMDSNMDPYSMMKIMTTYAEEIKLGKMACLAPRRWGALFTVKLFCQLDPAFKDVLHISSETFAHGILTFAFGNKVDPLLRHFLEYRFRTFHEVALLGWGDTRIKLMNPSFKQLPEYLMLQCNWFMRKDRPTVLTGITMDLVYAPFKLFAGKIISAIPVLLLEIAWFSSERYTMQRL